MNESSLSVLVGLLEHLDGVGIIFLFILALPSIGFIFTSCILWKLLMSEKKQTLDYREYTDKILNKVITVLDGACQVQKELINSFKLLNDNIDNNFKDTKNAINSLISQKL